jgi:hypothetical protein
MVIELVLIVLLPVSFVAGFFCALKAVQMGLKWKQQVENGALPTTEKQDKAPETSPLGLTPDLFREWTTGETPKDDDK